MRVRSLIVVILLSFNLSVFGTTYYVATYGNDGNPGTSSQPFATWQKAINSVTSAGDVIYIRGGVYYAAGYYSGGTWSGIRINGKSGTSSNTYKILAYPGENPILDGTSVTQNGLRHGLQMENVNFWVLKGLTFRNFFDSSNNISYAAGIYACNNISIEQCSFHDCGGGANVNGSSNNIEFVNCDSYNNYDSYRSGEDSNGFFANISPGMHINYIGCRAWHNSDDGFDLYGSDGYITFENCWSFNNGFGLNGDGVGFKLGAASGNIESGVQRVLSNCIAFGNVGTGFDESQDEGTSISQAIYNCVSYANKGRGFDFTYSGSNSIIRNCISLSNNIYDGFGSNTHDHNSWDSNVSVSSSDFIGLDYSGVDGSRQDNGALPSLDFLHLASGSDLIDAGVDVGLSYSGNSPDIGCFESGTASTIAPPVFLSSSIENSTPSVIEITFSLTLANIVPSASNFTVNVNSSPRSINSISVSGTKVLLTLSTPVIHDDKVTVDYSKPSSSPLQSSSGGEVASFTGKLVSNNVYPASPAYLSSSIENASPSRLELIYSLSLASTIPSTSSFSVMVNSSSRSVSSISVSGTKVTLTLSSPVAYGDIVTFAYTRPSSNPLQSTDGGQISTSSPQSVTNNVQPTVPSYISSVIQNSTPAKLEITYSQALSNSVPSASAFSVTVNSASRSINSVAISGTIVTLTLSGPVAYGDAVNVSYTKPSSGALQTSSGGQAASFTAQKVTNNVGPVIPVFTGASVENAAPSKLVISYNMSMANIIPATSAFSVTVNSVSRAVSSVAISGTSVSLTLASAVANGNTVKVSYTKPSSNPLQTPAGGQAASFTGQTVTNNVQVNNAAPVVMVNYQSEAYSGFVEELNASGSYDSNNDKLTFSWVIPGNIPVSSTTGPAIEYLSPVTDVARTVNFVVNVSDGKTVQSKTIPVLILPYEPGLDVAEVVKVQSSGYTGTNLPTNIIDGNIGTMWAAEGDNQWLLLTLREPFSVQHVKLAFQAGQKKESYFDILGSEDTITWESVLSKSNSCAFSGDLQVFDFPATKASKEFRYIKLIGHSNSADSWNYISEFRIFGYRHKNPTTYEEQPFKIFPNPAHDFFNVKIEETTLAHDFLRIVSITGSTVYDQKIDPGVSEFRVPINLLKGIYLVQIGTRNMTLFSQKLVISR